MYHAYERIYARCGLKAVPVQADGGDMGDSMTHEFHVLADAGEDGIAFCGGCGYAANLEKAERRVAPRSDAECPAYEEVHTPGAKTIEQVAAFMGLPGSAFVKSLIYSADGKPVMVCVEGDRDVNDVKLKRFLGAKKVELADFDTVQRETGAQPGSVGPVFRDSNNQTIKQSNNCFLHGLGRCLLAFLDGTLLRAGLPLCLCAAVRRLPARACQVASPHGVLPLRPCGVWTGFPMREVGVVRQAAKADAGGAFCMFCSCPLCFGRCRRSRKQ
jgi:prolyl-tRNA editing enzyme YbaK/EbsC (Cys-tRNA(Pro) deacylase)